jgi:leucyl aminopeptidase
MTLAKLSCLRNTAALAAFSHQLWIFPAGKELPTELPARAQWQAVLSRRKLKAAELSSSPQALDLDDGARMALVMVDAEMSRFERLVVLRKAMMLLLDESPQAIALASRVSDPQVIEDAAYVAWVNGVPLPVQKKKPPRALAQLHVLAEAAADFERVAALARANVLTRELTALPPNVLTPASYRKRIRALAKTAGWGIEEYDLRRLQKMGAGAFCAVAQGSAHEDAAIVHLTYRPRGAKRRVALVGKGICFDTGGHNLKPARYMQGMHEDMNGSAVVLGLLAAASESHLPVAIDAWVAIAHNHISPDAYTQNSIVTALDGTTIEIVHTDAEGRMVLADTLVLAAREKPELIVDFATLTGSMVSALGNRYAGVFATSDALAVAAIGAGRASGERVCVFPMDEDYEQGESGLESKVADVKQCTLAGEADHILAARFLKRFVGKRPWVHVDLSTCSCPGGLGAVASDLTGFGVAWGIDFIQRSA